VGQAGERGRGSPGAHRRRQAARLRGHGVAGDARTAVAGRGRPGHGRAAVAGDRGSDLGAARGGGRGDGRRRGRLGAVAHRVGGVDGEGVGAAVGQAGDRGREGGAVDRHRDGRPALGRAHGVTRDGRAAVIRRRRPGDGGRPVAAGRGHAGRDAGHVHRDDGRGARRLRAVADGVGGVEGEGIARPVGQPRDDGGGGGAVDGGGLPAGAGGYGVAGDGEPAVAGRRRPGDGGGPVAGGGRAHRRGAGYGGRHDGVGRIRLGPVADGVGGVNGEGVARPVGEARHDGGEGAGTVHGCCRPARRGGHDVAGYCGAAAAWGGPGHGGLPVAAGGADGGRRTGVGGRGHGVGGG